MDSKKASSQNSPGYTFDARFSKRVSFLMQTKNHARFLKNALEGCRKLVGPDDELIVVDGASTDETREVVGKYNDVVDVFISEPDVSGNHAQNKGILLARGKYIKYISDDDVFYPEAMGYVVKIMEDHPEIDLLLCGGTKENIRTGHVSVSYVEAGVNYGRVTEDVFVYHGANGSGQVIRRASLARLGILFPVHNLSADAEFVLQVIKNGGCVKFCRVNLFHHIIYDHSMIWRLHQEYIRDTRRLVKEYCPRWFYIKYLLKDSPFFKMLSYRFAWILGIKNTKPQPHPSEIIWDGGLS